MIIRVTVPMPPSYNSYFRFAIRGRKICKYISAEGEKFKKEAALRLMQQVPEKQRPCFSAKADLFIWIKYYRAIKARDIDNSSKQVLDCLQGFVYPNDKQISGQMQMRYDTQPKNPRCEILVCERLDGAAMEQAIKWFVYGTEIVE